MRRTLLILPVISAFAGSLAFGQAGQSGLTFLQLGVGARPLGMGEAYSAIADDPAAAYYNPAALAFTSSSQLLLMHKEWVQDVRTEFMAASTSLGRLGLGLSVDATSVDDIEIRDVPGPPIGTFDARNAAIGLSAAYSATPELSLGLTGKFLYEKILVDEASGYGFDLGALYRTPWNVSIALAVDNLGSMGVLHDEASVLPKLVRAGAGYQTAIQSMDGTLTFAADYIRNTVEQVSHMHLGGEFNYRSSFAVRLGYQTGYDAKNISAGVGVRYGMMQLDYAFVPFRYDFGTTHTFSLLIRFD